MANVLKQWRDNMVLAAFKLHMKSLTGSNMLPTQQAGKPVYSDWNAEKAISDGYKASTYVYKSIERKATAAATVPWKVYKLKGNAWEEQPGHPLEALIEQPNPFMDRAVMIERMTAHLDLTGNALLSKVRGIGGVVAELWPIEPQYIKPVPNKTEFIGGYEYKKGQDKLLLKAQDVLHAMYVDPGNIYWGMSPLQVAAKTVDTDVEAVNWNKIALQNRAVTDGVLSFNEALSRSQWEETRAQVREQKQGASNARDMWVLGGGAKWNQMSLSPVEMDFIQSRRMTREEITAIFGVPLILMGIMEGSTYANYQEARKAFWEDTTIPYLNRIRAIFNQSLVPEFQAAGETLYLDYDTSGVPALQENFQGKVTSAKDLWAMGVPFNQINQRLELGFDDIEGGETGFIQSGLVPANLDFNALAMEPAPAPAAADPKKPDDDPDDDPDEDPQNPDDDPDDEGKSKGAAGAQETKTAIYAAKGLNLQSSEQKELYFKSMERRRLPWYAKFTRDAAARFKAERKAIAAAYKEGGADAAAAAITSEENQQAWSRMFMRNYKAIVKQFGETAFANLKGSAPSERKDEGDYFDPYDELIQSYLTTTAGEKIVGVLQFTQQISGAIIAEMEAEGANVDDIARALEEQFDEFSINRAFTIARTETAAASNYGLFEAGKQSGVATKKVWINSRDSRVRDSHDFKEAIDMDEKFKNGLLYPGDMKAGKAKEVIKCRCTMAFETE